MTRTNDDAKATPSVGQPKKKSGGVLWAMYCTVWIMISALSATYLFALAIAPDNVHSVVASLRGTLPATSDVPVLEKRQTLEERNVAALLKQRSALAAETQRLRETVSRLQKRLESQEPPPASSTPRQVATRPEQLATRPETSAARPPVRTTMITTGSIAKTVPEPTAAPTPKPEVKLVRTTTIVPRQKVPQTRGSAPPLPERTPRQVASVEGVTVINKRTSIPATAPSQAPEATAAAPVKPAVREPKPSAKAPPAVAPSTAPITFGAPTVTAAAPKSVALRLSSGPSIESLRLSWGYLKERHASILQGLRPRFAQSRGGADGSVYHLLAGPMETRAEATQVCAILRAQSVACEVAQYEGNTL
ncbi:MAG: hypothetical protein AAGC70_12625 [Pseudomonadota bacterium]